MLTPVSEDSKVNPYIYNFSYLTACYKYVIILNFIHSLYTHSSCDVYFIHYYFSKIWFMDCLYNSVICIPDALISSVLYPCITNVIFANLNLSACNFNPQLPVPIIDRHLHTFTFSKLNLNLHTWTVNLINVFCLLYCRQLCPAWNSRDISLFSTASNKSRGKHMGKFHVNLSSCEIFL